MRQTHKSPYIYLLIVLASLLPFQNCGLSGFKNISSNQQTANEAGSSWYSNLNYEMDAGGLYPECTAPTNADLNNDSVEAKSSYGSATDENSYILADLGAVVSINRVRVGGRGPVDCWGLPAEYWNSEASNIEIQVSLDKVTWRTVAYGDQVQYFNSLLSDIGFATETVRYVRIFRAAGWLATGSFRVGFSSVPLPPPLERFAAPAGTDHWYSALAYSTGDEATYEGCEAPTDANMNDGVAENKNSWGSSTNESSWLQADLGSVKSVNEVLVGGSAPCWGSAADYWPDKGVIVQVSSDGQVWQTVADGSAIVYSDTELKAIYFAPRSARYVRLYADSYISTGQFRVGFRE